MTLGELIKKLTLLKLSKHLPNDTLVYIEVHNEDNGYDTITDIDDIDIGLNKVIALSGQYTYDE